MHRVLIILLCVLLLLSSPLAITLAGDGSMEESLQRRFYDVATSLYEDQRLVQYGYQIFEQPPTDFEALRHLPVGPNYVLGPGDTLIIRIYGTTFKEYELEIDRDGRVNIPDVGPIELIGLTFREARDVLGTHIESIYSGIHINITMGELRSIFVHVIGEVNRPGIHKISNLSTVIQALFASNGPSRLGSLRDIHVYRDHELIAQFDVYDFLLKGSLDEVIRLRDNDMVFVPTIGDLVAIGGEVKRPGIYELKEGMSVNHLLEIAGGLTPMALRKSIAVERIRDHEEKVIFYLDLEDVDEDGSQMILEAGDLFMVYPMDWIFPFYSVHIQGAVREPGTFNLYDEMSLSDLIFQAGGLKEEAYLDIVEIYRHSYGISDGPHLITVSLRDLEEDPSGALSMEKDVLLMPGDRVYVRTHITDTVVRRITLVGEVHLPGEYTLQEGERLSSVIERAGGLTEMAYPFGAMLTREDIKRRQRTFIEDFVSYQRETIAQERARLSELSLTTLEREERSKALDYQEQALDLMLSRLPEGRILFDLESALDDSQSNHNLLVHHRDRLVIPPRPQVVILTGEVFNPEAVIYEPGRDLDDYLHMVGGITSRGDREAIYIIKASGQVESLSTGYGPLKEGDMIVVPPLDLLKGGH